MRNRAFLKVVLLGLVTLAFAPGLAAAAGQGADLTEMLASSAATRATAVSPPLINATPSVLNCGVVDAPGVSAPQTLTIKNVGEQPLDVMSIEVSPLGSPFTTSFPLLGVTIQPGISSFFDVFFTANDAGQYSASLIIHSNAANGDFTVGATGDGNVGPVIDPIADFNINAFTNVNFTVMATDGDDDQLVFSMDSDLPPGATFLAATQVFDWTPNATNGGSFTATFTATDGRLSDTEEVNFTVTVTNRPPTANAGGSYIGTTGVAVQFNGSGSSDPDEAPQSLIYTWTFGDGGTSNSISPGHPYAIPGNFIASLQVCDNGSPQLCDSDVAAVQVKTEIAVAVLLKNNGSTIRSNGGGKEFIGLESIERPLTDIDVLTVRMSIPSLGMMEISAQMKGVRFGDYDLDAVQEIQIPFLRSEIRSLVGTNTNVPLVIQITGQFTTPTGSVPLRGTKTVTFKGGGGGAVEASAYPNPFNPETSIAFSVQKDGPVSIRIYSINGRLVRTLKDGEFTPAGSHEVRWNGLDGAGNRVSSGLYFVKTSAVDGHMVFKLAVTK